MRRVGWNCLWILLVGPLLFGACAWVDKHAYHTVTADLSVSGPGRISVATRDRRPYVLQQNKGPQFVGTLRSLHYSPFDVTTEDDRPLADGMTQAISNSLAKRGFRPVPVFVSPFESTERIQKMLAQGEVDRAILLTLREWKSDTYADTVLHFDVILIVLDRTEQVIGEKRIQGRDNFPGAYRNASSHAREVVSRAFKGKLEELLNDPAVANALRPSP